MPVPDPIDAAAPVVVVGGGQGGFQVAASLREAGHTGPLTVVGDEPGLPYQRPPLSKAYLTGILPLDTVVLRGQSFFDSRDVTLRCGEPVVRIDRDAARVELASGGRLDYAHLVLAVGARARELPVPGADLDGVALLRTLAHADALRPRLAVPCRVVVIGAGFIGMEVAAVAATAGHQVTVVEELDRAMARAVAPELSAHVTAAHESHGSRVLFGRTVLALRGGLDGAVREVELDGGERLPADLVLVGVGVTADTGLAAGAGLAVDDGIVVDEWLLTADPRISAIGDCASYPSAHAGARTRLESVQNAVDQARYVARRLTVGVDEGYRAVPWFWTHQFDMRIQMAGVCAADDHRIVRGDPAQGRFSVFRFHRERLLSVESVNRVADHMAARKVLAGNRRPTVAEVAQDGFDLKTYVAG